MPGPDDDLPADRFFFISQLSLTHFSLILTVLNAKSFAFVAFLSSFLLKPPNDRDSIQIAAHVYIYLVCFSFVFNCLCMVQDFKFIRIVAQTLRSVVFVLLMRSVKPFYF